MWVGEQGEKAERQGIGGKQLGGGWRGLGGRGLGGGLGGGLL